ncbi:MAG: hypothetical protein EZS28_011386 [Streblomastix strix]|uniref:Uncharacterized protein n=1 Tax=Streblomastix strix TaxID=222440 RepID=A0A5J4WDX0_9EUKA|nr:MAG: hypothetical protein EZS28_011386 [Streblomastix strix]
MSILEKVKNKNSQQQKIQTPLKLKANEDVIQPLLEMIVAAQHYAEGQETRFWIEFSTACGRSNQFAICKDSTKLWDTSIYAREHAIICSNSLSDLCINNSVSISPFESIVAGNAIVGNLQTSHQLFQYACMRLNNCFLQHYFNIFLIVLSDQCPEFNEVIGGKNEVIAKLAFGDGAPYNVDDKLLNFKFG